MANNTSGKRSSNSKVANKKVNTKTKRKRRRKIQY